MPPDFQFLRPFWLLALLPLGLLLWHLLRRGAAADPWRGVVDPHLLPHLLLDDAGRVRRLPVGMLGLGWLLGVLALAGPVWERLPQPVYRAQASRVIVLDLSPTMNATDLVPSRLARARFEVQDLLRRASEGQTALLAYGSEPFVVSPLTADTRTIAAQVPDLSTDLLPEAGLRRADLALAEAGALLRQSGSPEGEVILVTDGLDHPAAAQEAARKLLADGYRVSVLGVGTGKGAPVPQAGGGFLKDGTGAILMPRLDSDALASLARAGGGRYLMSTPDDHDVEALIPAPRADILRRADQQDTRADQWREEGPWLLLALLPIAALGFRRGWLGPLLLLLFLGPPRPADAFEWQDLWLRPDQQAARSLAAGKAAEASARFERPDWQAAAHYQAGDYAKTLSALDGRRDPESDYNRGNALAHMGRLDDALASYERAIERDPGDEDARFNRDLVRRLIERQESQDQASRSGDQGQDGRDEGSSGQQGQQGQQDRGSAGAAQTQEAKGGSMEERGRANDQGGAEHAAPSSAQSTQSTRSTPPSGAGRDAEAAPDTSRGATPDDGLASQPVTGQATAPGMADLLGGQRDETGAQSPPGSEAPGDREELQAAEQMLRRVPDDPAGLLRQRFLLQHLRRTGELPR